MLPRLTAAMLTERGERLVAHGRDVGPEDVQETRGGDAAPGAGVRLIDRRGRLLAVAERAPDSRLLHPSVVLM
jgi:hypothetical protein